MELAKIIETIEQSSPQDWVVIGRPTFIAAPTDDDERPAPTHHTRAAYRPNAAIGIAWGLDLDTDLDLEWIGVSSDRKVTSQIVDTFYNGMLVHRWVRVIVDGGRCGLPFAQAVFTHEDPIVPGVERWVVTRGMVARARLIQELGNDRDFDTYMARTSVQVISDDEWRTLFDEEPE